MVSCSLRIVVAVRQREEHFSQDCALKELGGIQIFVLSRDDLGNPQFSSPKECQRSGCRSKAWGRKACSFITRAIHACIEAPNPLLVLLADKKFQTVLNSTARLACWFSAPSDSKSARRLFPRAKVSKLVGYMDERCIQASLRFTPFFAFCGCPCKGHFSNLVGSPIICIW